MALAVAALGWTGIGETSHPMLSATDLPANITNGCYNREVCHVEQDYMVHWLGKTPNGNLFLVMTNSCEETNKCDSWLVEKTRQQAATLLSLDGKYRLVKGSQPYPDVQLKKEISDTRIAYSYFEWQESSYVKTISKDIYRVDGVECGTAEECHQAALTAMQHQRAGEAIKIWETVHHVSWI
jgi:hypothetical protein